MGIKNTNILLGSGSPRRKLLLEELGFTFRTLTSKTKEVPLPHLKRDEIAVYLAEEKADALVNQLHEDEILITADTIVWLEPDMLGKPNNENEAFEMLKKLNGRKHQVYTGVCLQKNIKRKSFCVTSEVSFNTKSDDDIRNYIELYQPFDKAGSYGAQECLNDGFNPCSTEEKIFLREIKKEYLCFETKTEMKEKRISFIDQIEGSYFNVMGLPIVELWQNLLSL